jgi:1-acyl-sn-glycerol-3-phosphate acyltransferase
MSDTFYKLVRFLGRPVFRMSSSPTVLHADRLDGDRSVIVAPNHLSPYDVPCLMASTNRLLDFVSIVEIFRKPVAGWFLGSMNAFPLDRGRTDPATARKILDRLERGRTVVMFPEGQIRAAANSVLAGGGFKASVTRLARLANVPIVPCVVLATGAYGRPSAWLPLRRTRYAINYCAPLRVSQNGDEAAACAEAATQLKRAYDEGHEELRAASGLTLADSPWRSASKADDTEAVEKAN